MKKSIPKAYLEGDESLRQFYSFPPTEDSIEKVIKAKSGFPASTRAILSDVLLDQNKNLPNNEKTLGNISLLRKSNTYCITTGHQVCLFTGPLFTIYKGLTTIVTSNYLNKKYPDYHFVPIFWMATEDHDFEEVNHVFTGFDDKQTYKAEFRGAVGRHPLQEQIQEILDLPEFQGLDDFYQSGLTFGEAFRKLIHHVFGEYGLVIVDADSEALKAIAKPLFEKELNTFSSFLDIKETNNSLQKLGFKTQLTPREINLFILSEESRERLIPLNNGFASLPSQKEYDRETISTILEESPSVLSPNVALRPIYQELVLPNLAYTGGWGELSYWFQLKKSFETFSVPFPLLIPRISNTFISKSLAERWQNMGFKITDFDKEIPILLREYLYRNWDSSEFTDGFKTLLDQFDSLIGLVSEIEPTQGISGKAQKAKLEKFFSKWIKKIEKNVRRKTPEPYESIEEMKNEIGPRRLKQERVINFFTLSSNQRKELISKLSQRDPFNFGHSYTELSE